MKEIKVIRILLITTVLLVICNIGLILVIWLKPGRPPGRPREMPREFVIRNLGFSQEQVKQYDSLIALHRQSMERLKKEMGEDRQRFFNGLSTNTGSDSMSRVIGSKQAEMEMATYNHFRQVRAICNDSQKPEFDKIINEVTRMMGNNDKRGPRPGVRPGQAPPPGEGTHAGEPEPNDRDVPPPPREGPPGGEDDRPGPPPPRP